jgi:hypothetical protein
MSQSLTGVSLRARKKMVQYAAAGTKRIGRDSLVSELLEPANSRNINATAHKVQIRPRPRLNRLRRESSPKRFADNLCLEQTG